MWYSPCFTVQGDNVRISLVIGKDSAHHNNNNNNVYLVFAIVRLNKTYEKIKKLHGKNITNIKIHWIY